MGGHIEQFEVNLLYSELSQFTLFRVSKITSIWFSSPLWPFLPWPSQSQRLNPRLKLEPKPKLRDSTLVTIVIITSTADSQGSTVATHMVTTMATMATGMAMVSMATLTSMETTDTTTTDSIDHLLPADRICLCNEPGLIVQNSNEDFI